MALCYHTNGSTPSAKKLTNAHAAFSMNPFEDRCACRQCRAFNQLGYIATLTWIQHSILSNRFQPRVFQHQRFHAHLIELDYRAGLRAFGDFGDPADAEGGMTDELAFFEL
jgi:hypothetical protein